MTCAVRLREEWRGDRVHQRWFLGDEGRGFQLAGTLVLDVGEYQTIGAALLLGRNEINRGYGRLVIETPDSESLMAAIRGTGPAGLVSV